MKLIWPIVAFLMLTGCATSRPIDYARAHTVAVEADTVAATWQAVLDADKAEIIGAVREIGAPVIAALAAKAQDPDAPDPTPDLQAWLELAHEVALRWEDERQQRIALAALSSLRVALIVCGVNIHEPPPEAEPEP